MISKSKTTLITSNKLDQVSAENLNCVKNRQSPTNVAAQALQISISK